MIEMLKRPKGIERTEKVSHAKRNPKSELKKIKEDNRLSTGYERVNSQRRT